MKKLKQNTGITLVALVITIIVLLILAGITINLTVGQRGILNRAQEAGKNYEESAKREDEQLSNFLKEADKIMEELTPKEPEVSEEVKALKVGDYIKYDTGVSSVGENGVVVCRVLYPVSSEYGLQIVSDKSVKNLRIVQDGSTWEDAKTAYNGLIKTLDRLAKEYINTDYVYDARCIGSIPTVKNGMFIDSNKETETTVQFPMSHWDEYTRPSGWETDDTGYYEADTNYKIDQAALKSANTYITGEYYMFASRDVSLPTKMAYFCIRRVDPSGGLYSHPISWANLAGMTAGLEFSAGFRFCVLLKSKEIKLIGGDGTKENPYIMGV